MREGGVLVHVSANVDPSTFTHHIKVLAGEEDFVFDGFKLRWYDVVAKCVALLPIFVSVVLLEAFSADALLFLDEKLRVRVSDVAVMEPLVQHSHVGAGGFAQKSSQ